MAHGGKREGAGRPQVRVPYEDPRGEGIQPVAYMLAIMRDEQLAPSIRYQAAKDAAPYCSARLQSRELTVDADVSIELVSYLDQD